MKENFESGPDLRTLVLKGLREQGINDPGVKAMLGQWVDKQHERLEGDGTASARIAFEMDKARLFFEAGYVDQALDDLWQLKYDVEQAMMKPVKNIPSQDDLDAVLRLFNELNQ